MRWYAGNMVTYPISVLKFEGSVFMRPIKPANAPPRPSTLVDDAKEMKFGSRRMRVSRRRGTRRWSCDRSIKSGTLVCGSQYSQA